MHDAISFNGVSKIYRIPSIAPWHASKKIEALKTATFQCPRGAITCLLGPNGAGKTTIIKILAGLITHESGSIELFGRPYQDAIKKNTPSIGVMASNDRSFYWRLTGRQNLEFFCALYGYRRREIHKTVNDLLSELDIAKDADKPFRLYSTGIRQRVLLARALLSKPEILLLDEPTSHIDPMAKESIHALIKENFIRKRNATILLCTHDLHEVQSLGDHIVLLNNGSVPAEGSRQELKSMINPGIAFTIEFSRMPARNWARRIPVTIEREERGRILCAAADRKSIAAAVTAAVAAGGRITGCAEQEVSIVDIFSRLAGGGAS